MSSEILPPRKCSRCGITTIAGPHDPNHCKDPRCPLKLPAPREGAPKTLEPTP